METNVDRTLVAGQEVTGVLPDDGQRTRLGGSVVCPVCAGSTPDVEIWCGECGYLLSQPAPQQLEPPTEAALAWLISSDGRRFPLRSGKTTIGRADTDIISPDGSVSRTHAEIAIRPGGTTIQDLDSTNGTSVDGRRLNPGEICPLADGASIKLGGWQMRLEAVAAAAEVTQVLPTDDTVAGSEGFEGAEPFGWLRAATGDEQFAVTAATVTAGRGAANDIVISDDNYVSGVHVRLEVADGGMMVTDLGSTNGTLVNGERLAPHIPRFLSPADTLQIGVRAFRIELAARSGESGGGGVSDGLSDGAENPPADSVQDE
ncbi:MAG: FHA domain-containing protein [Armatimonadetes bacterium]|nr:FHA domain-containing protein [Armatimonadota bacterium]MDE2206634.1 FHA domain-containing protein [Armatimonadota bacterium]